MSWFDMSVLIKNYRLLISGIDATATVSVAAIAAGMVIGAIVGMAGSSSNRPLNWLARAYVETFRSIPVIILVFWMYYALPILVDWQANRFTSAFLALGLYSGSYCGEIWRSGLKSVASHQKEGAEALGFGYWNSMRYVILPQAARNMFPSFVTMAVDTTKMSAVASAIAYPELLYKGQLVASTFYRPIEAYTGVAVIFIVIIGSFTIAMDWVERRLAKYGKR